MAMRMSSGPAAAEPSAAETESMMSVNIPDDLKAQVDSWADDGTYQVTLRQTGQGEFELVSIDKENAPGGEGDEGGYTGETNAEDEQGIAGTAGDTGGTTIPSKNPAVAALIIARRKK